MILLGFSCPGLNLLLVTNRTATCMSTGNAIQERRFLTGQLTQCILQLLNALLTDVGIIFYTRLLGTVLLGEHRDWIMYPANNSLSILGNVENQSFESSYNGSVGFKISL